MTQQDFQDRLARLRDKGHAAPTSPGLPPTARPKPRPRPVSRGREILQNLGYPLSLAGAFFLGLLAVFLARYIRFHIAQGATGDQTSDIDLLITAALGMGTSFVLAQMFRLRSKEHAGLQGIGVFVAICTLHNLFHWFPTPMATVFSDDYVTAMQEMTPANTAIFRGTVLNLVEQTPEAAWDTEHGTADPTLSAADAAPDQPEPRLLLLDSEK